MKRYPVSDHCDGEIFFNPSRRGQKSFGDVLKWAFTSKRAPWPKWVNVEPRQPPQSGGASPGPTVTFINHATVLLQTPDVTLLTDPVFSKRVSPVRWAGPKRVHSPGVQLEHLPPLDAILLSHNHYDHMDVESLRRLQQKMPNLRILTPLGNQSTLSRAGLHHVHEMDWWEQTSVGSSRITLTPAHHWSGRGLRDRFRALWGGFFVESKEGRTTFFAGDTGYDSHFSDIRARLGAPHVALLPVGAYEPRWFMKDSHMNPEEAVRAHLDLGASLSVPIHYGTFQLTDEAREEPLRALARVLAKTPSAPEWFRVLEPGDFHIYNED